MCAGVFIREIDDDDQCYINPTYDDLPPDILDHIHLNRNGNNIQERKTNAIPVLSTFLNKIISGTTEDDAKTVESKGTDEGEEKAQDSEKTKETSSSSTTTASTDEPIPKTSLSALEQVVLTNKCTEKLIGHILATKTTEPYITDEAMMIPKLDQYGRKAEPEKEAKIGHCEAGRNIAIHSIVVDPAYQNLGVGTNLIRDYINRMSVHGTADKLILLAHDEMVPFYQRLGFVSMGPSPTNFGGGNWIAMEKELEMPDDGDDY